MGIMFELMRSPYKTLPCLGLCRPEGILFNPPSRSGSAKGNLLILFTWQSKEQEDSWI